MQFCCTNFVLFFPTLGIVRGLYQILCKGPLDESQGRQCLAISQNLSKVRRTLTLSSLMHQDHIIGSVVILSYSLFVSQFGYLSVCLPLSPSLPLHMYIYTPPPTHTHISVYLSLYLCINLFNLYLSISLSTHSLCLFISVFSSISLSLLSFSIYSYLYLSLFLCNHSHTCLSFFLSFCLSMHQCVFRYFSCSLYIYPSLSLVFLSLYIPLTLCPWILINLSICCNI